MTKREFREEQTQRERAAQKARLARCNCGNGGDAEEIGRALERGRALPRTGPDGRPGVLGGARGL